MPSSIEPARVVGALPAGDGVAVVRDGSSRIVAYGVEELVSARGADAAVQLARAERAGGFWAGFLAYDLGRCFERVPALAEDDRGAPDVLLARFAARAVLTPGAAPRVLGRGAPAAALRAALDSAAGAGTGLPPATIAHGAWHSNETPRTWSEKVGAILELLRDGECYQVNLTRRLSAPSLAGARDVFGALTRRNPAPHAALIDLGEAAPECAVVSASPELFLRRDDRSVETSPIKGTAASRSALVSSAKDRAENVMIVDLARNDLGRVCEFGSVRVPSLCAVERHPGLYHLVSAVTGELRPGTSTADLVAATFPPASVTGAPKPRVLRAIEELEPCRRGVYCGAVGWIDADHDTAELNVAIRTMTLGKGRIDLGVGGGIVADSDATAEWAETELKAARLVAALGAPRRPESTPAERGRPVGAAQVSAGRGR